MDSAKMDSSKSTAIGFVLIFVIFVGWLIYMNSQQAKLPKNTPATVAETTHVANPPAHDSTVKPDTSSQNRSKIFAADTTAEAIPAVTKTIQTPYFIATISSNGAAITSFQLRDYNTWDKKPVELVSHDDPHGADIDLKFVASDGKTVSTNDLPFMLDAKPLVLGPSDSISFSALYKLDTGRTIEKVFHFSGNGYLVGIEYKLRGLENTISGYHYTAALDNPLPFVEKHSAGESTNAKAFVGIGGDMEDLTVTKAGANEHKSYNGDITYAGMRTQYFEKAMIPTGEKTISADLYDTASAAPDGGVISKYAASINIPIGRTSNEQLGFNLYFGPLEYNRVEAVGVGLEQSMNFGWSFVVRPISIYLLMPLFLWLHSFISNWGLVIILFSVLIKIMTIPLSTGQMRSMRKMQVLQPKMTEIRNKYKDDPKKTNEETMKLYKTYGVNPVGGCLPLVLQMPILFALYSVLRNVIQLRQAPFLSWINDLSTPDVLFHFGTKIPIIGETMSGLTLLLVVTMFVQQMFTVTDPRQKQMAYIMPVMFIFMFNNLPSGVALYYFTFNILGLIQQLYLTKIATQPTLDELEKAPKKGGGLMSKLQDMEKQQREVRKQQYSGKKK